MSVKNAAYPQQLGSGPSAPHYTSNYASQYDPGPSPSDALVSRSHRSIAQDPNGYHTQNTVETVYDPTCNYHHPIAPSLDSRVGGGPMYHTDPYGGYSTIQIPYCQPPGAVAPHGVTSHKPGGYASEGRSLYGGQQSDDDYQRHNAERNRREGRAQDRFGQRDQPASKMMEFFLDGERIYFDVLQRYLCKFLGPEASFRPAEFKVCTADI